MPLPTQSAWHYSFPEQQAWTQGSATSLTHYSGRLDVRQLTNSTNVLEEKRHGGGSHEQPTQTASTPPRRPLQSRTRDLRARLAQSLPHENIYNLPNLLTFSRLLATPAIGYLILHDTQSWAVGLFAYAGITDLVDGWIARRWKLQTVVGSVVDPIADKALMTVLTVCLALKGGLPVWLATLILNRDVSLALAAIYYRFASLPRPKTFARYWDFSLPSAEVHPTTISKANTALQLVLIGATTALPLVTSSSMFSGLEADVHGAMNAFQLMVAGTTVWSGASYLYTKDAVKILGDGMSEKEKKRILVKGRTLIAVCFLVGAGLAGVLEMVVGSGSRRDDDRAEGRAIGNDEAEKA
ncbi:MAG: hypothetical protein M1831_001923 [Alyxoria varia]|nr:MAG: hypothetical protein M1831_001923 [Alyxoria varia]